MLSIGLVLYKVTELMWRATSRAGMMGFLSIRFLPTWLKHKEQKSSFWFQLKPIKNPPLLNRKNTTTVSETNIKNHEFNSQYWSLQFHLNKSSVSKEMECCSSTSLLSLSLMLKPPPPLMTINYNCNSHWRKKKTGHCLLQVSAISYQNFIHFALNETKRHTLLLPSPLQERYSSMIALDGKTRLEMLSFDTPRIRLLRSMSIEGEAMQVLDFAAFPKPEFDLPIFCGNFFTAANTNIVVLDLNPLHDVTSRRDYKEKYYDSLVPLGLKYTELLPWGGKLTSESIKFFSPMVIWTKFTSSKSKHEILYSAFVEYYKAWIELMEQAVEDTDPSQIVCNLEAQHRYLTWRAEKVIIPCFPFLLQSFLFL
ncbi:phytochromobilin:ferredoxin oxidoreductase, chloroplastic-like [Durio zibethinus]|uniref:Phytochromobilin:ferredoxin oxidoreductase, chloroplastic-like n=1 Tax=Durio zibethinus TaxID=66656 RepID=A0A6P5ZPD4_DURZI|nr:phytochromobilin:ferredoxin oxidoreductase, chloroplastic-like [Durio zibethinus]